MNKSKRTQEHYQLQNKDKTSLNGHFRFTSTKSAATVNDTILQPMATDNQHATPTRVCWIATTQCSHSHLKPMCCHQVDLACDQHLFCLIHPQIQVIWTIHQVLLMCKRLVRLVVVRSKRRDLMSRKITSPILRKPFKGQNVPLRIGPNFENKSRLTWQSTARVCHYQKSTNTLWFPTFPLSSHARTPPNGPSHKLSWTNTTVPGSPPKKSTY